METITKVSIGGTALPEAGAARVLSIDVSEAMNAQTQVSIVAMVSVDDVSTWTSPLDPLAEPFAKFEISIVRGRDEDALVVPARATSASWTIQPGGASSMTVAGLDASAELDREEKEKSWAGLSDGDIARQLLAPVGTPRVGTTPPARAESAAPRQRGTDWAYVKQLAERNQFDVWVTSENGTPKAVFDKVDPLAKPSVTLDLGYGALGGSANVTVQLVAGQAVKVTHAVEGQPDQQVAFNDGKGHAMGPRSLGGAVTVLRHEQDLDGRQTPDDAARIMAENSAFGATLSITLAAPETPLVRARRTAMIRGLGPQLSGLWLVRSVRHAVTPGGHTQTVSLTRNALGDSRSGAESGLLGALSGAVSGSISF